jgi:hypothetical protein
MLLAALCDLIRSLAYRAGMSVAAGRVGAGVLVGVVAYLVLGAAVVGWAMGSRSCVYSFRGAGIIGGHTLEVLGRLEAVVGGAPA